MNEEKEPLRSNTNTLNDAEIENMEAGTMEFSGAFHNTLNPGTYYYHHPNHIANQNKFVRTETLNSNTISKYINYSSTNSKIKWTKNENEVLKKIMMRAYAYASLYNQSYFRYMTYHKLLTWPLCIVTCISVGLQTISATLISSGTVETNNGILSIITTSISVIVSILTYLQVQASYESMAKGCKKAGRAFSEFAEELNTLLSMDSDHRKNPLEVITGIQIDYNKMKKIYSEFPIPDDILKAFIEQNKNNNFLIDLATNTNEFNITDGVLEKNIIINRFLDSIASMREKDNTSSSFDAKETVEV